jgi:multicomponent Na+:H+ antiporter subunit A
VLGRQFPALAIASGIAAAGLGALPLTLGFFKDELFFAAALERGPLFGALAIFGAALTFSYVWYFWSGIFLGPRRAEAHHLPPLLVAPIVALAVLILLGGFMVAPAVDLASAAGAVSFADLTAIHPAYHFDARPENLMACATYALGAVIILTRRWWRGIALAGSCLGETIGPERIYREGLAALNRFSRIIFAAEVRDLRGRIATVLIPAALLVAAGFAATPFTDSYRIGAITASDLPLVVGLVLVVLAALTVAVPRSHLSLILALSSVGYTLAAIFAFFGAPNVALIMALVETIMTLLILGILSLFPRDVLRREQTRPESRSLRRRDLIIGIFAALFAFASAWGTLSQPAINGGVAFEMIRLTPDAHAKNAVTAILADFRGLDTLGEITVIFIAFIGLLTLLGRRRVKE